MTKSTRSCTYDQFDMQTFEPLNEPTRIRLAEVNFQESTFKDKTVLDIGANSGLLTIEACRKGAAAVTAIDVTPLFIEYLESILDHHDLPMTVRKQAVAELDPETDVHDIVLFFEVIHWTTSQGMPIPVAIEKVANVTGETLIIEFPWDIREPSIRDQTTLTIDDYDSSLIIEELSARFHDVRFDKFMSYFRGQAGSRRALMTARSPKLSPAFFDVEGFRPAVELPVAQGENSSSYARANGTDYFLKALPSWAPLSATPLATVDRLLSALGEGPLLHPLELNGRRVTQLGPRRVLAYPWLGNDDGSIDATDRPSVEQSLDVVRRTIAQLNGIDADVVDGLATHLPHTPHGNELAARIQDTGQIAGLSSSQISRLAADAQATSPAERPRLVHGDLHRSNMLRDREGSFVVTDLDTLQVGGPFTDLYWQIGFEALGETESQLHLDALQELLPNETARTSDALAALGMLLGWFRIANERGARTEQLERVKGGVQQLISFALLDD